MPTCSICDSTEAASIINDLLEKKTALDVIAQQTGFHRSSVHRHSKRCFPLWKAARLKAKRGKNDDSFGRIFVQWPGESVPSEIRPNDTLLVVTYESIAISLMGNPRAVPFDESTADSFFDAALVEDAERARNSDQPAHA
jgi:hypothetical protein